MDAQAPEETTNQADVKPSTTLAVNKVKLLVTGAVVVVVIGALWRSMYVTNKRELDTRRADDRKRAFNAALRDTPARRFTTTDGSAEATRKALITDSF